MLLHILILVLCSFALAKPTPPQQNDFPLCYSLPGSPSYPIKQQWAALNISLDGNLISTTPLASPCHNAQPGTYNATACTALQQAWPLPQTHYTDSASIMANFFTNNSCNPFSPPGDKCDSSGFVAYSARVRGVQDIQETIAFATAHNVRLAIRNTGHDYLGKSNAPGGLAIWTHFLKEIEVIHDYRSPSGDSKREAGGYTGPAMKLGAGVQGFEARKAAAEAGYILATGNCDTIGIAGGYTQGGGHGQLTSRFGLAADQVLEWEVVLASGEVAVATPEDPEYEDLYWALSGGGGGVFGVVVSVTVKVFREVRTVAGALSFSTSCGGNEIVFRRAVDTFIARLGALLDVRGVGAWFLTRDSLSLSPVSILGGSSQDLHRVLDPVVDVLEEGNLSCSYQVQEYPTYYDSYEAMTPEYNVTDLHGGNILIPRSVLETNMDGLTSRIWEILDSGNETAISGISVNASLHETNQSPGNSVNPAWREAAISAVVVLPFTYTDWPRNLERRRQITQTLLPKLERLTPAGEGGAYLNEADPNQPDWQHVFYGDNYDRLLGIKRKYDPDGTFYALTGVGSEEWVNGDDGRLCRSDSYLSQSR
ncbi:hypothetical protein BJY01DRAFT_259796 [Aspergillus pseudoustus]|uniref:FAD-binding PCMH-type domain-containing protein n=1 Tax=Aspergillus pseudoustus TaxID=1810923 RepID=A0ABR4J0R2_9EURO